MAHDNHLRDKARSLRLQGYTLPDIMERLSLPKTTIYGWIADMPRPARNPRTLAQSNGTKACIEKYTKLRDIAYQKGVEEAPALFKDSSFRDFVTIYLCEGFRRDRNRVSFANSNPIIVQLCHRWFIHLATKPLNYMVQVHVDHDIDEIATFWGNLLHIDGSRIRLQRKSNSNQLSKRQFRSVHGVLSIELNDTYIRARLQAWMDILQDEWLDFANE